MIKFMIVIFFLSVVAVHSLLTAPSVLRLARWLRLDVYVLTKAKRSDVSTKAGMALSSMPRRQMKYWGLPRAASPMVVRLCIKIQPPQIPEAMVRMGTLLMFLILSRMTGPAKSCMLVSDASMRSVAKS